ncbi:hypothetical protein E8E12_002736 [Didymella heteroderae]|uniref:Uncharacterized protein n=1 Tax=Didymella heteroderae TaxID=1769908 RepID=A0A9P4WJK7_9PLEO|nr:hypothetical protein E8E12_002736 [Didymella heteroderae]
MAGSGSIQDHLKVDIINIVDARFDPPNQDFMDWGADLNDGFALWTIEHQRRTSRRNHTQPEHKLGVRIIFLPTYKFPNAVRIKVTKDGESSGEKVVPKSLLHDPEGHMVLIHTTGRNPAMARHDSHSPVHEPLANEHVVVDLLRDYALFGTMTVTFEDVTEVRYYTTSKEDTFQRRNMIADAAELELGEQVAAEAAAFRIPRERIVDCGYGSMSWEHVHADKRHFAMINFKKRKSKRRVKHGKPVTSFERKKVLDFDSHYRQIDCWPSNDPMYREPCRVAWAIYNDQIRHRIAKLIAKATESNTNCLLRCNSLETLRKIAEATITNETQSVVRCNIHPLLPANDYVEDLMSKLLATMIASERIDMLRVQFKGEGMLRAEKVDDLIVPGQT